MRTVKFTAKENTELGYFGFVPTMHENWFDSSKNYMPLCNNFGHDLLHHGTKETGSVTDELRALGCAAWMSDLYSAGRFALEGLESDLLNTLRDGFSFGGSVENGFDSVPAAPKRGKFNSIGELKELFEIAFEGMAKALPEEIQGGFYLHDSKTEEDRAEALAEYDQETARIKNWLAETRQKLFDWVAYGFWCAEKRRYRKFSAWQVQSVYNQLDKISFNSIEEYERLSISYDIKNNIVSHRRYDVYDEEYY